MGLGAVLKGIGKAVGSFIPGVSAIADVAGSMAGGGAQGRLQEYMAQLEGERLALQRAGQAKEFEGTDQRRMLVNDLLSRMQDVNIDAPFLLPSQSSGGIRPSALSPEARAAMTAAAGQYRSVMPGATTPGKDIRIFGKNKISIPGTTRGVVGTPAAGKPPQAGAMDKLLGILGGVGAGIGAISPFLPKSGPNLATLNTTYKPPAPNVSFGGFR